MRLFPAVEGKIKKGFQRFILPFNLVLKLAEFAQAVMRLLWLWELVRSVKLSIVILLSTTVGPPWEYTPAENVVSKAANNEYTLCPLLAWTMQL